MGKFHGEFVATMDNKGRFMLPGGLKKQLPENETTFMICRGFEKCLKFYTKEAWDELAAKLLKLNEYDVKERNLKRLFLRGMTEVELDSTNRILLPQSLKEYAGIEKDIVLSSSVSYFEIWDEKTYNALFNDFSEDEFSKLAKEFMGDK